MTAKNSLGVKDELIIKETSETVSKKLSNYIFELRDKVVLLEKEIAVLKKEISLLRCGGKLRKSNKEIITGIAIIVIGALLVGIMPDIASFIAQALQK